MSGREIILPVGLLLFCDGGERSEDVLKKRSFPSPGLFVRLGSGVIILCLYSAGLIGLVVVVPDFVRSVLPLAGRKIAGDFVRRPSAGFPSRSLHVRSYVGL